MNKISQKELYLKICKREAIAFTPIPKIPRSPGLLYQNRRH
ncbi:MAG: hypothetical protein RMX68_004830 [Aulosira sp. ZfuVER01]|nr:hypothetical protein [Aulosira sp. ZfuVER01]MDZ8000721.1 hypothetical protein [Aulosira sp. DedVER01a]MDZ8051836.1 hypothetical protein [Aulosira sp. ZfuCHP01]